VKDLFVLFAIIFSLLSSGSLEAQTFRNPIRIPTTQDPVSIFTVDVNVDGVPDILYEVDGTLTAPSSMDIFFGQPSGGFIAGPTFTLPTGVGGCRPVDANNDGKLDLACLHLIDEFDAEVAVFLGN